MAASLNLSGASCPGVARGVASSSGRSCVAPCTPRRVMGSRSSHAARFIQRVASVSVDRAPKVDRPTVDPVSEGWSTEDHVPGQVSNREGGRVVGEAGARRGEGRVTTTAGRLLLRSRCCNDTEAPASLASSLR